MMEFSDLKFNSKCFTTIIFILFSQYFQVLGQYDTNNSNNSDSDNESSSISHFKVLYILFAVVLGLVTVLLLLIFYFKKARKPANKTLQKQKQLEDNIEQVLDHEKDQNHKGEDIDEEKQYVIKNISKGKNKVVLGEEKNTTGKLIFIKESAACLFQINDLLKAPAEGLGKGIFGNTYKAVVEGEEGCRTAVVVKRLRHLKPLSNEEFTKQLLVIAGYKHPNLLPLFAYYCSKEENLLVYKFAQNGNLFNRIHGGRKSSPSASSRSNNNKDRIPFRWSSRLLVARCVSRALEYLHMNNKSTGIQLHGNLKSSNILLDENDTVVVSDYGFSSLLALPIATQRMISYKSPEYQSYKKISRKSDVWSYGCLLLELLTGRISLNSAPPGVNGVDLCSWVLRAVREEWTAEIFDPEISVQRSAAHGMFKILHIAIQCCNKSPDKRPEMAEVVREVESVKIVESGEDDEDFSFDHSSLTDESLSINVSAASVSGSATASASASATASASASATASASASFMVSEEISRY